MIMTEEKSKQKRCPKCHCEPCKASECMWWEELHPRMEREDHSGAGAYMSTAIMNIHKQFGGKVPEIKREGPPGCQGILVIEARGCCAACRIAPVTGQD